MALGHKSVKDMLRHVSSRELGQWMAYERYEGPIGPIYERAVLRQIASLLDGDEKSKPFPTPVEFITMSQRPVDDEQSSTFAEFDAILER